MSALLDSFASAFEALPSRDAGGLSDSRRAARPAASPRPAEVPESAIDALREIEFDRATGKLSDDDYASLKTEYTRTALVEMRAREPVVSAGRGAAGAASGWGFPSRCSPWPSPPSWPWAPGWSSAGNTCWSSERTPHVNPGFAHPV